VYIQLCARTLALFCFVVYHSLQERVVCVHSEFLPPLVQRWASNCSLGIKASLATESAVRPRLRTLRTLFTFGCTQVNPAWICLSTLTGRPGFSSTSKSPLHLFSKYQTTFSIRWKRQACLAQSHRVFQSCAVLFFSSRAACLTVVLFFLGTASNIVTFLAK
jgi:hypothetical protein